MTMTRDTLEVDVLIVGGGPAGLSAALRLAQLQKAAAAASRCRSPCSRRRARPARTCCRARVLDPSALRDLIPDFEAKGAPLACEVHRRPRLLPHRRSRSCVCRSSRRRFENHGNYIISLNTFVRWLAEQVEAEGVDLFTGFAGQDVLIGRRRASSACAPATAASASTASRSRPSSPASTSCAKVTIFCDGVRGNLTKELLRTLQLGDEAAQPEQFAIGLKELWEVPAGRLAPGTVIHTLGYPLRQEEFGGGFIYAMPDGRLSVGFVVGLDYQDPLFDPHVAFKRFKQHPFMRSAARRRADGALRRQGAARGRLEHASRSSYIDGGADRRRRRRTS